MRHGAETMNVCGESRAAAMRRDEEISGAEKIVMKRCSSLIGALHYSLSGLRVERNSRLYLDELLPVQVSMARPRSVYHGVS
jgi:hypothetical protein